MDGPKYHLLFLISDPLFVVWPPTQSSGHGGGGCRGEGCEMDDDGGCEVCVMRREIANFKSDGAKQFLVVASDGCRDSLVRACSLSPFRCCSLKMFPRIQNLTGKLLPEAVRDAAPS